MDSKQGFAGSGEPFLFRDHYDQAGVFHIDRGVAKRSDSFIFFYEIPRPCEYPEPTPAGSLDDFHGRYFAFDAGGFAREIALQDPPDVFQSV